MLINVCLFSPLSCPWPEQAMKVRLNGHGKSNPSLVSAADSVNTNARTEQSYSKSGTKIQQCYSFLVRYCVTKTMLVTADFLLNTL